MTNNKLLQTAIELYKKCPEFEPGEWKIIKDRKLRYWDGAYEDETLQIMVYGNIVSINNKIIKNSEMKDNLTALIADLERHLGIKPMTEAEAYAQLQEIEQRVLDKKKNLPKLPDEIEDDWNYYNNNGMKTIAETINRIIDYLKLVELGKDEK